MYGTLSHHIPELCRRKHILSRDQKSAGIFIKPVYNPVHIGIKAQFMMSVPGKPVGKSVLMVTHGRVNGHVRWFVDHHKIRVLVNYGKGNLGFYYIGTVLYLKNITAENVSFFQGLSQPCFLSVKKQPVNVCRQYFCAGISEMIYNVSGKAFGTKKSLHGLTAEAFRNLIGDYP